jgi:hypothetical protein
MFAFDEKDEEIRLMSMAARDQIDGIRIGDYLLFPTGQLERFSHDWGSDFQTSPSGSFFLSDDGHVHLSCGGLNPGTPLDAVTLTKAALPGSFWFFHHGRIGGGRRVDCNAPCRVFRTTAKYSGFLGVEFESKDVKDLKSQLTAQGIQTI